MKTREVKLGEVANVKGGKRIPKGIGLINIPNGHPYIRVRDLNNKRLLELDNSYEYVDNETQIIYFGRKSRSIYILLIWIL